MSALCGSDCCGSTVVAPPVPYSTCDEYIRSSGVEFFGTMACDYEFTDISSPAEWEQAKLDGHIQCSPIGNLTPNAPTETIYDVNRCGKKKVIDSETTIDFTTIFVDQDGADFDYFYNLDKDASRLKLFWVDCEGFFYFCDDAYQTIKAGNFDFTTASGLGISAGMDFSVTQTPYQADQQDTVEWTTQFSIKEKGVRRGVKLPGVNICC